VQAANIEAEAAGVNDSDFRVAKNEYAGLAHTKYSGIDAMVLLLSILSSYKISEHILSILWQFAVFRLCLSFCMLSGFEYAVSD